VVIQKLASSPSLFIHGRVWYVCSYCVFIDPDYMFYRATIGLEQQYRILLGDVSNVEQSHPMLVGNLHMEVGIGTDRFFLLAISNS
jgi:hypothetical protein